MGTLWSLRLDNPALLPLEQVRARIEAAFGRVIAQMSTWDPSSDISRYNNAPAGSVHPLAPEFLRVLECALQWADASGGALDPTVGPLVGLWGFGPRPRSASWPSQAELLAIRRLVDWKRIDLDARAATLRQPGGIELDFSGIAKGFAVDHACAALKEMELHNFLLEVGGELSARGTRPDGRPWRIRIDGLEGEAGQLALSDMSVATSGDRWHSHTAGGRRWSHTIDPRTGQPAGHSLTSVSVLHPECMQADALATLLTVMGPADGLAFARDQEVAALFVVHAQGQARQPQASPRWPAAAASSA